MGVYNENTNWDNERRYLEGLIEQGGGNAVWAQQQMNVLNDAQQQYSAPAAPAAPVNGVTQSGTGAIADLVQRAGNVAQTVKAQAEKNQLADYLRQQYTENTRAALARLKAAYERNLAGYDAQEAGLGGLYDAARNRAAAQSALERMSFGERAAASGLSGGAREQAELYRAANAQSTLAGIDRAQADAQSDIDLARRQLTSDYENAAAEAQANGDSQLAQALYEEMLRQEAESSAALEARLAEAQAAATPTKPTLTAAQTLSALKEGVVNDTTRSAYEYYFGQPYDAGTQTSPVVSPVYTPGTGYNNGTLDPEQVRQLQALLGVAQDGYWGPATQAAANAMWGTTDADTAYRTAGGRTVNPTTLESGANYSSVLADIQQLRANGAGTQTINSVISAALNAGTITAAQAAMLRSSYVGSGR